MNKTITILGKIFEVESFSNDRVTYLKAGKLTDVVNEDNAGDFAGALQRLAYDTALAKAEAQETRRESIDANHSFCVEFEDEVYIWSIVRYVEGFYNDVEFNVGAEELDEDEDPDNARHNEVAEELKSFSEDRRMTASERRHFERLSNR